MKSKVPTRQKMMQVDKQGKRKRAGLRKRKIPLSGIFYQGLRNVRRIYHPHPYQCITLILVKRVHIFYQAIVLLLFDIILHFQCMKKKFRTYLSPRKSLPKHIQWSQKKIIPQVTTLRKYLVPSHSTFIEEKLVKKGWGKWIKLMRLWRRCRRMKFYLRELMKIL